MRGILFSMITVVGLVWVSWTAAAAQGPTATIAAGTYRGNVRCTGSDRFSNGSPVRHYRSSPVASVVFDSDQRVTSWTYFFLLRHDLVKQVRAVRPGQSFTYAAGKHISRPGQTRVTIADVTRTRGQVLIIAYLDWASPTTHYIGSGTYALSLERLSGTAIRYEALKVVVKHPVAAPSTANPVIRRNESCRGQLTS